MVRLAWVTGALALGCAGLRSEAVPVEALLVQQPAEGGCRLQRVTLGQPEPRLLGVVPGTCTFERAVVAPDGGRLLLGRSLEGFEVDLISGQVRALPKLEVDTSPALPDPELHVDGEGVPLWKVVLGEGE